MIEQITALSHAKLAVIGDLMLDRYWSGDTGRISPEAPVPVVRVSEHEERPGGAGNVALNLQALGINTTLFGAVGDDDAGVTLSKALDDKGILKHLVTLPEHRTIIKLRVLSLHQQLLRLDFEEPQVQHPPLAPDVQHAWQQTIADHDVIILSDYGKGLLRDPQPWLKAAQDTDKITLVDPKGDDFSRYQGATLITPNSHEFERVVGPWSTDGELVEKARSVIAKHDLQGLLITLGARGMCLLMREETPYFLSAHTQSVYDVTGAGDTVIAVMGAALASGMTFKESAKLANLAASVVVGRLGAAQVSGSDLRGAWMKAFPHEGKVIRRDKLPTLVQDARSQGERIVMTNGCFDILHAGHVTYLEQAKRLGDRLIVAINDDASVSRLKGSSRPINQLANRQAVLAGLSCVDWVVSFHEDTPRSLLQAVRPDVLVKGGDYQLHEVVGSELVLAYGGSVKVLSEVPGLSVTNLVKKFQKSPDLVD